MRLGKNMKYALLFINNCTNWHTFKSTCRATLKAILKLEMLGLVEINRYQQFRITDIGKQYIETMRDKNGNRNYF